MLFSLLCVAFGLAADIDFRRDLPGAVPRHWTVAMTHAGGPPRWEVVLDPSAPSPPHAFAQLSTDKTNARYPLAIYGKTKLRNGSVSVRFKTISGEIDQAAGILWRYRDPENYYIVRANALENNVVLYKVEAGKRTALAPRGTPPQTYGVKHPVPKLTWSALRVDFEGARFTVFLNGEIVMHVDDPTFPGPGLTGLWTKADSVTWFDDFRADKKIPAAKRP